MTVTITKPIKGGTINAIASKSAAHRLLICAALASKDETFVQCPERSEDIDATAQCLNALGANIHYKGDGFYVKPINVQLSSVLPCKESGSTLRFLLPVCGALGVNAELHMAGRLPSRPLTGLYEEMERHGCTLSPHGVSPLVCQGQLTSGDYSIAGNISSQFISGLLFALPLLDGESNILVKGKLESRPYVDMTLEALQLFGIEVEEKVMEGSLIFSVKGGQKYQSPKTVHAEGDWSNAAFWLSAGAIGKNSITMEGINLNSRQGDKAIVNFLKRFGAKVDITEESNTISISPGKLRGIEIDASQTPDLVPILSAVASVAEGKTVIRNAKRLRIKESDRLKAVTETLTQLGADIKETDDGLIIVGQKMLKGGEVHSFGDHRIAMTAAVLSAVCENPVVINGAHAVRKSYPAFFEDFNNVLGGEVS